MRKAFYCNKFINWSFNFRFDINFKELIQIFANSVFEWIEPWPPKSPRIQISFNSKSPFLLKKSFHFFSKITVETGGRKYQGEIRALGYSERTGVKISSDSLCSYEICDHSWGLLSILKFRINIFEIYHSFRYDLLQFNP